MFHSIFFLCLVQITCCTYTPEIFDYVIVGGGPAGLILAHRLSATSNISVAVIEAGDSAYNNPNVTALPRSIAEFSPGIGTSVEWKYKSAPQKYTTNKTLPYYAGKALGGTTVINGMTYIRAEKAQIDAWEELGNKGWNWDSLWEYYLAQERFQVPSDLQRSNGATFIKEVHGLDGELAVGFTPYLTGQGATDAFVETSQALGYPHNLDVNSGNMRGFTVWPSTLNVSESVREDAARAFYFPVAESRLNLHVFLNTTATRIIWDGNGYSTHSKVASGVEALSNNATRIIHATKEVIVAAGSIRSPALLEHSGIGNPTVLESLDIKTVVSLLTVGSNLQDQPANGIIYASSTNWTGYPTYVTYLTASDLFGDDLVAITKEVRANLSAYASLIVQDYAPNVTSIEVQEKLLKHQVDLVFASDSTVPLAELLWIPYETAIIAQYWNLLPLSRGSIHITSPDPTIQPSINPNFLQLPIDRYVQAAIAIRIREYFATVPLSNYVTGEVSPGFETVPQNASWRDPAWQTWIDQTYSSNSHPLSTCAMMSKDLGGVVDTEGKVYGTKNVRVVDASVFPTQISGHLSASVYAIAGKIADSIWDAIASTT